jgi:ABC-type nitrate/sulfonate/bicarbonate transport system substrate-binding protein
MPALTVGAVSRNYFNMPLWIAQHAGFFNQEGLSVTIELIEGIDEVTRRLVDGRFHLALNVTENTILNSEQGGRLEIIAGNVNRLPFSFIARPHIRSYADLRGARIGVSSINAGSSSLIMRLLASHGLLHPRDYTLVPVGPILARWKMLLSGEIDAGLQGAPLNYVAVDAGFTDLGNPRTQFPDFQFTSLDADRDWAKRNETVVVRFLRAYTQAHHWFYENKGGATQIAQKEMSVDRHYAERAWADYVCDEIFPRDGRASVRGVQTLLTVSALIRDLAARSRTRAEQYINHSYLEIAARG